MSVQLFQALRIDDGISNMWSDNHLDIKLAFVVLLYLGCQCSKTFDFWNICVPGLRSASRTHMIFVICAVRLTVAITLWFLRSSADSAGQSAQNHSDEARESLLRHVIYFFSL